MTTSKLRILRLPKWLVVTFTILTFWSKPSIQAQCLPDIVGIWEEEQDVVSALLAGKKVYKFEKDDKVEIYQYNFELEDFVLLGTGTYKLNLYSSPSKIIFYNLTVLIFQTEGSFAFPVTLFEISTLEWEGIFGIKTRLHKLYVPQYDVPLVSQNDRCGCWAAAATMMYSWKKGRTYAIGEALAEISTYYYSQWKLEAFPTCTGLASSDNDDFFSEKMGMTKINYTPTPNGLGELLSKHGPLLVVQDMNTNMADSRAYYHARVINGISGSGKEDCTFLNILDPWAYDNNQQETVESFKDFNQKAYKTFIGNFPEQFRIYHW